MTGPKQNKTCNACGGTGQLSFFKGVSRFLLSHEECPECAGTGLQLGDDSEKESDSKANSSKKPKKKT